MLQPAYDVDKCAEAKHLRLCTSLLGIHLQYYACCSAAE